MSQFNNYSYTDIYIGTFFLITYYNISYNQSPGFVITQYYGWYFSLVDPTLRTYYIQLFKMQT